MKKTMLTIFLVLALSLILCSAKVSEAGTAFTYQGFLYDANSPADDIYDFKFTLYDAPVADSQVGSPVTVQDVNVVGGLFTVKLDFGGGIFTGDARWLEIGVRPGEYSDPYGYTVLKPLQEVTPAPYAIYAGSVGSGNDWMISGSDMYSVPSGNVGIGTSTPSGSLYEDSKTLEISGNAPSIVLDDTAFTHQDDFEISNGGDAVLFRDASDGIDIMALGLTGSAEGNVGIGTKNPSEKLDVEGNIDVSDNRVKNYHGFPRPDYNSGWVPIAKGELITINHNLGRNANDYVVVLDYKDLGIGGWGINNAYIGSTGSSGGSLGVFWSRLRTSQIQVNRKIFDGFADEFRIRIWVYD